MAKTISPDRLKFWQERVEKSNGQSMFVPDAFKEEYDEITKLRKEMEEMNAVLSEKAADFGIQMKNWWYKLQKYLKENGHPDIFTKDIGEDGNALEEGIAILNITEPHQR